MLDDYNCDCDVDYSGLQLIGASMNWHAWMVERFSEGLMKQELRKAFPCEFDGKEEMINKWRKKVEDMNNKEKKND